MKRLQDKTALITGGARGIGAAIAELFYHEGAKVIITDILDDLGKTLAKKLGPNAAYKHLDVQFESEWESCYQWLKDLYGNIDILVNNAGITGFLETSGPFNAEEVDLESWKQVHAVNLDGVMLGCKHFIQNSKYTGGSIINISSRSGMVGIPAAVAYASSKAAVRNHSKSVALYCADQQYNIRCNSLHPAAIMTPMWDIMLGEGDQRTNMIKNIESGIPLGHFGVPEDVAYAALYLASDESKYVTGIELTIDGGILAGSEAKPKQS